MEVADTDPRGDIRDLRVLQPGGASRAAPDVAVVNEDVDQRESFGYRHWLSRLETPSGLSQRDFPQHPRGRSATLPPQILWLVPESAHDPRPRHRALDFPSRRALRVGGHRLGTTAAFCHDVDYPPAESTRARKSCRSRGWEHGRALCRSQTVERSGQRGFERAGALNEGQCRPTPETSAVRPLVRIEAAAPDCPPDP